MNYLETSRHNQAATMLREAAKTPGSSRLLRLVTLLLAAVVLIALTGCANAKQADSKTATQTPKNPAATSGKTPQKLKNPHEITGISYVTELGDPQPITGNFKTQLPATVTDAEGTKVTVKDTSRILALDIYGTLSRTVIALGLGDHIVGRSTSSTETQLAQLPRVTENGHTLNAEAVLALKPTVIIADRSIGPPEAFAQIRAAGVPIVFVTSERSIAVNTPLIESVANALGIPEAGKALATRTDQEVKAAAAKIKTWEPKTDPMRAAFLYVRGTGGVFFILGKEYGANSLISGIGAVDVAAEKGIKSMAPASAEALVSLNPDVYLLMTKGVESAGGIEAVLKRPGVSQTTAGRKPRAVAIPDGVALSFGPQTGEILTKVAAALYGVEGQ